MSQKYNFNLDINDIFSLIFGQGNYNVILSYSTLGVIQIHYCPLLKNFLITFAITKS